MSLQKICPVGTNGTLGSALLQSLLTANLQILTLQRSPTHPTHPNTKPIPIDPNFQTSSLPGNLEHYLRLAYAAAVVGRKRYILADFGSCDAASQGAEAAADLSE